MSAGDVVELFPERPAPPLSRPPLREIVGEVSGPTGLYEVLECFHIQRGVLDPVTGASNAERRRCGRCQYGHPHTLLEACARDLGVTEQRTDFPLDPSWEVSFIVAPSGRWRKP